MPGVTAQFGQSNGIYSHHTALRKLGTWFWWITIPRQEEIGSGAGADGEIRKCAKKGISSVLAIKIYINEDADHTNTYAKRARTLMIKCHQLSELTGTSDAFLSPESLGQEALKFFVSDNLKTNQDNNIMREQKKLNKKRYDCMQNGTEWNGRRNGHRQKRKLGEGVDRSCT
ncbi:hypothetical protein BU17DRAFT_69987 [Hysterangium stoloniferum]|nr:hypothetical protein BU17DRAFT_69987 [Hysterangium stoloniferum]